MYKETGTDLWTVESFVQTSLDHFAFVAITPSPSTLDGLIEMVESENKRVQKAMDAGVRTVRSLTVNPHPLALRQCGKLIFFT